jgi:hypothetical protein
MSEPLRPADDRADVARTRVTEHGITEVGFDDPELRPLPADKLHYHVPHPDPHPELHEHSDVPIRPLAIALAGIAGTCVVTGVMLYAVFWNFKKSQDSLERPRTGVPTARPVVPEPRLQGVPGFSGTHPSEDMRDQLQRYRQELTSYGRTEDGKARLPIDRAMDLALERKMFPVAKEGGAK